MRPATRRRTLIVDFDVKTDPNNDLILAQIRETQAASQLPADVTNYGVTVQKVGDRAAHADGVVFAERDATTRSSSPTTPTSIWTIRSRASPGIGSVQVFGAGQYAMRLWVKPDQLAKLGITVPEIVSAIQAQNTVNPAGQSGRRAGPAGQEFTYSVRAQGRLTSPEEFGEIVVRETPDGGIVRVKDVARIELGAQDYTVAGPLQRKAERDHRRVSVAGIQRRGGCRRRQETDG